MKQIIKYSLPFLLAIVLLNACKKDYVYEVDDVVVNTPAAAKTNNKTTTEFVSIAYSDIFGTTIPQAYLQQLSLAYLSFGDKKLIEDIIIKNMLNAPGILIPTNAQMLADIDGFITNTYKKFYNRIPTEYELWGIRDLIQNDTQITPELIYYAFLTSDEYRYY